MSKDRSINNDSSEKGNEKDNSNGKESLVLRQSKQLTRDPSTVYMFVARDLEKILILYDFFFSFSVHLCVFTIFSFSLILWYRHGIEKSSYARSSYATFITSWKSGQIYKNAKFPRKCWVYMEREVGCYSRCKYLGEKIHGMEYLLIRK